MKNSPSAALLLFALTSYASDSMAQLSVQKIAIQPATSKATITLENNSPKDVTAYGLSIDNIYTDGHAEHQEKTSDMGPPILLLRGISVHYPRGKFRRQIPSSRILAIRSPKSM